MNRGLVKFLSWFILFALTLEPIFSDAEYHFFPGRPVGAPVMRVRGIILDYARGNDIGSLTVSDYSGHLQEFNLARSVSFNGQPIECAGTPEKWNRFCSAFPKNLILGKTSVTVSFFAATYEGKIVRVVDDISTKPEKASSPTPQPSSTSARSPCPTNAPRATSNPHPKQSICASG
jgi:hypothetical protein